MRMMLRVTIPVVAGNAEIQSGKMPKLMAEVTARLKPEAAYFTTDTGHRTAYFFFDLKDVSDMPSIGEPFFMELNAKVEFMPVMNAEDLQKGLSHLKR